MHARDLSVLLSALRGEGLHNFGILGANATDLPVLSDGTPAGGLMLIGNVGSALWPHFSTSPSFHEDEPLDHWSVQVLGVLAERFGLDAVFPFTGPPYHPFQRWANQIGGFSQTPLGVLAHGDYGPWFAFRGALLFRDAMPPLKPGGAGPCVTCRDKPCLDACPARAISRTSSYQPEDCRAFVAADEQRHCATGCLVRKACPYGVDYRYWPAHARFHMDAFAALFGRDRQV